METTTSRRAELRDRACAVLPGGNTRTTLFVSPHPPYAAHGERYELVDAEGHRLIDLHGNYTALVHGHAHPAIVAAATEGVREGSAFGLPTEAEIELAEELCRRVAALERVRFTCSGTEAVMMAIRAARVATGRTGLLRFEGAYHGTYDPVVAEPALGVSQAAREDVVRVPLNDEQAFLAALDERGDRLACVLLDLMPNRTGLLQATESFVRLVRAETARRGVVLVLDEVITFRLAVGGLQALYGIDGDLVTFGKIVGGGFPVGAFGGRADLMDAFDPSRDEFVPHGGTFSANPVTMRAGLAALELLDKAEIARINALGDSLRARLADLGLELRGRGSLLQIAGFGEEAERWWRAYDAGVLLTPSGLATISTPMDESVVDEVASRLDAVV
jgi:glutamate-1-semialdehyde 2,1-aminomutase